MENPNNYPLAKSGRRLGSLSILLICIATIGTAYPATEPDDFPPPLKTISRSEREQMDSARNFTELLRRANALMDSRLRNAERAISSGDEMQMFFELGAFHGLMDETLARLLVYDGVRRNSSQISNLRRFEIALRGYPSRIELIRRRSFEFDIYIMSLQRDLRDARSRALDPLYVAPSTTR
jgi:hypothetical protein